MLTCEWCNRDLKYNRKYLFFCNEKCFNNTIDYKNVIHLSGKHRMGVKMSDVLGFNQLDKLNLSLVTIRKEYLDAKKKFKPFHNYHEAYAILKEEVDELWDAIKSKDSDRDEHVHKEAIQVSAMALGVVYEFFDFTTDNKGE